VFTTSLTSSSNTYMYFQHRALLDHTCMHCPRRFTAAIKCSGTIPSPLWQITLSSLLGMSGLKKSLLKTNTPNTVQVLKITAQNAFKPKVILIVVVQTATLVLIYYSPMRHQNFFEQAGMYKTDSKPSNRARIKL